MFLVFALETTPSTTSPMPAKGDRVEVDKLYQQHKNRLSPGRMSQALGKPGAFYFAPQSFFSHASIV
jgi:hypothetical protein